MTTLGIHLTPDGAAFTLRPDPAAPAVQVNSHLPKAVCQAIATLLRAPAKAMSTSGLGTELRNLMTAANASPRLGVLAMGKISALGLVVPRDRVSTFATQVKEAVTFPVHVFAEDALAVRAQTDAAQAQALVLCTWGSDLSLTPARLSTSGTHLTHLARATTFGGCGLTALGARMPKTDGAQVAAALAAWPKADATVPRRITGAVAGLVGAGLNGVQSWIDGAAGRDAAGAVILAGPILDYPAIRAAVTDRLGRAKFAVAEGSSGAMADHLHAVVTDTARLAYDIGVLFHVSGAVAAVGSLLLCRPTEVGAKSAPYLAELSVPTGEAIEIAFYLRRIDYVAGTLSHEVIDRHPLAVGRNAAGNAVVETRIEVLEPSPGDVRVSITALDKVTGKHATFDNLRTAGSTGTVSPLRDPRLLRTSALLDRLANTMAEIRASDDDPGALSVKEWRQKLAPGQAMFSRRHYADLILQTINMANHDGSDEGSKSLLARDTLLDPEFVRSAEPPAFQSAAQQLLFIHLVEVALFAGGSHDAQRAQKWGAEAAKAYVASDEAQFNDGFNALSQDLAGREDLAWILNLAQQTQNFYRLASRSHMAVRFDWEGG